jgi:hypothetical protein
MADHAMHHHERRESLGTDREETTMNLTDEQLLALTRSLEQTHDHELTCDEYLEQLAAYAEKMAQGAAIPPGFEQVRPHEQRCANCAEETSALVEALKAP